jgi:spermidine synthase
VVDDGRNYLLMHPESYDVITIDPPPPMDSAGCVNLLSREFVVLCRQRLRPGGVVCMWIPEGRASEVKMILSTFLNVFPDVQVWSGVPPHYGFLLHGTHQPLAMNQVPGKIRKLYENPAVAADLREWGSELDEPAKILDLYVGDDGLLRSLAAGGPIITDDHPYTEFPLWRSRRLDGPYYQFIRAVR